MDTSISQGVSVVDGCEALVVEIIVVQKVPEVVHVYSQNQLEQNFFPNSISLTKNPVGLNDCG